jgi:hypothetical protein
MNFGLLVELLRCNHFAGYFGIPPGFVAAVVLLLD